MIIKRRAAGLHLAEHLFDQVREKTDFSPVLAPQDFSVTLPDGSNHSHHPSLVVYGKDTPVPLWVVDVDAQACGGAEDFSDRIRNYSLAGVEEYWLIYPKDGILVVRRRVGDEGFGKAEIYGEGDRITPLSSSLELSVERILGW